MRGRFALTLTVFCALVARTDAQPSCNPGDFAAQLGPVNGAVLDFNGTTQYVEIGNPPALNITGQITMEAWIRPDTLTGAHNIVTRSSGTLVSSEVSLRIDQNIYEVVSYDGQLHGVGSGNIYAADAGHWIHLAGTYDGTGWRLYRNGELIASRNVSTGAVFVPAGWRIGTWDTNPQTPTRWFDGAIAEVRIWNITRTQPQIQSNMFADVTGQPGLVGRWKLNEESGTTAFDSSGADNNGTIFNGPARPHYWRDADTNNTLDACQTPQITQPPSGATACDTSPVLLAVTAGGTASAGLAYQWTRNSQDIPGETLDTLFIEHPVPADSGEYRCRVSNALNPSLSVTSSPASVTVNESLSLSLAWGRGDEGQTTLTQAPIGLRHTAFAAGARHSLALRSDGAIVASGDNSLGQCNVPPLPTGATYTAVAAGDAFSLALRSDGAIAAWGDDSAGQCNVPPLPVGVTYTAVAAGFVHALALRSNGTIIAWGDNGFGQLNIPAPPPGVTYTAIAAGWLHSLALRSDGHVIAWGNGGFGQLSVPALPVGRTYTAISSGAAHSAALRSDGRLVAWGLNDVGQSAAPAPPPGRTFTQVACGSFHTLALLSDGGATAFGESTEGQTFVPPLAPGTRYITIGSGPAADHSLASRAVTWTDPFNVQTTAGGVAVLIAGPPPVPGLSLRWRHNGADLVDGLTPAGSTISGATTSELTITNTQYDDAGEYDLRFIGPCDEVRSAPAVLFVDTPCPGDIDGDRFVGLSDIATLIHYWGLQATLAPPEVDLDGNGIVGLGDIAAIIVHWAAICQ
ncbi:MAG TPA: LamG-like jellyroll fold domain-containing protein [Phycisphaerales bacterium]|nr:LamG-like jellyroll fold domain-containing protein [Phycisphaerales bacterium]